MTSDKPKILFIGAVKLSARLLRCLISFDANIVGVCSKKSPGSNADFDDISLAIGKKPIPIFKTNDINAVDSIRWMQKIKPDIIMCIGWSQLLKESIIQIPKLGTIGYHPALLPKNRGRHPLIWALALGLRKTGSTFFLIDKGADTGPILAQETIKIHDNDDASTLYEKLTVVSEKQLLDLLPKLHNLKKIGRIQNGNLANSWRKRDAKDGKIDWRMNASNILNLVRSLSHPYVGAHFTFDNYDYKVWKCNIVRFGSKNVEPGKVLRSDNGTLVVKCGVNSIEITEIDPKIDISEGEYL